MKNDKQMKAPVEKNKKSSTQASKEKVTSAETDIGAASAIKRASAGRGLANEGTITSYEDEHRND